VVGFEAAADRGLVDSREALQEAGRLYKGDLLPACSGEWIEADRQRLRLRAQQVLSRLVGVLEADRAFNDAIEHAHQLLRLDPLDGPAWCALMRCHARRGERATSTAHGRVSDSWAANRNGRLVTAWRAAGSGPPRLCLVRGEAGIGKTRLAEELVDWSGLNGIASATTRCYAGEGRLAYSPIVGWLKSAALRPTLAKTGSDLDD
jgi:hypothetical protein